MPYWRLFYHATWATKGREWLIDLDWERALHNVIAAKGEALGAKVYAVGGIEDHVHIAASVPPSISLSSFIGQLKGNSPHWINNELDLPFRFVWQSSFGVVSFSETHLDVVVRYIKNQRAHHAEHTTIGLLEKTTKDDRSKGF